MSKPYTNCHARPWRRDATDALCTDMAREAQMSRCAAGDHGILSDLSRRVGSPTFRCVECGCIIRMSAASFAEIERAHRVTGIPLHDLIRGAAKEQMAAGS